MTRGSHLRRRITYLAAQIFGVKSQVRAALDSGVKVSRGPESNSQVSDDAPTRLPLFRGHRLWRDVKEARSVVHAASSLVIGG